MSIRNIRIYELAAKWEWSAEFDGVRRVGELRPLYGDGEESLVASLPQELRDSGVPVEIHRLDSSQR